ncbi:MAG TPA: Gfo/Idh/MocA family oxidoreductase [Balneolales bacterium]|nr:Gfo/Idh/MocA family oxidoreductase [Balneolales bacterium]
MSGQSPANVNAISRKTSEGDCRVSHIRSFLAMTVGNIFKRCFGVRDLLDKAKFDKETGKHKRRESVTEYTLVKIMESEICKVAVIGVGNIGYHHCRNFNRINEAKLVAVADIDPQRGKSVAQKFGCHYYLDLQELIKWEHPDAISIATPTSTHYEIARMLLFKGIHVLVEKPITTQPEEIEKLISIADNKNLILTVGHVERFNPALQRLKVLIHDGELGEITNIMARRLGGYPSKLTDVGVYYDLAVHDLDIFYYLLQQIPKNIRVHKLNVFSEKFDDSTTIFAEYENTNGIIQVNWITPVKIRQLEITGTRGYAELNYINQSLSLYERNVNPDDFVEQDFHEFLRKYGSLTKKEVSIEKAEPLYLELRNFVRSIKGSEQLVVKPNEVLITMKIMKQYDH